MHRSALLAGVAFAILNLSGYPAAAGAPQPGLPHSLTRHADFAIQPVVVMFNLAIVRRHMLDTLTELIGSAAPSRSPPYGAGLLWRSSMALVISAEPGQ